jgi:hypothetical protein
MSKYNEYFDKNNYEKFSEGIVSGNLAKKCFTFLKPKTAPSFPSTQKQPPISYSPAK